MFTLIVGVGNGALEAKAIWKTFLKIPVLLALAAVISGCAHDPTYVGREEVTAVQNAALPLPTRDDLTSTGQPYVIGPFDQISIEVFGLPEFSRSVQADASGSISYPLVGSVTAAGMTPAELARLLERGLASSLRDPEVTVNVTDTVSNLVTVSGEVEEPGMYPVLGRMSLMRAVASAKGLDEFAKIEEVVVFRKVNGEEYAALYDLGAIQRGVYADPDIYANDIIVVGDSPTRRLLRNALQAAPILTAPLIAVIQRN